MRVGIVLLTITVILQFVLELTMGRVFFAPSLIPFVLVYLTVNHGSIWAVDGAFWAGLCLDLLLHQPLGSSSIALLAGLYAARIIGQISAGDGKGYLLSMTATAVIVTDVIFMITASRPFGSGFNYMLLISLPRAAITVALGVLILSGAIWVASLRTRRVSV